MLKRIFKYTRNHLKMNWQVPLLIITFSGVVLIQACRDQFDKYYNDVQENSLSNSIIETLKSDNDYSSFADLVERSGIGKLLEKGAVYTVFAPINDAIDEYNRLNPANRTSEMDSVTLANFVNFHIAFGIYYNYDFGKRYIRELGNRYQTRMYNPQTFQYKQISVFPSYFFGASGKENYTSEYTQLYKNVYNPTDSTFNVEGANVIKEKSDKGCTNGVIHGINKVLNPRKNIYEVLLSDEQFSIYRDFLMRFDTLIYDPENSRIENGVEQKAYKTEFWYKNSKGVPTKFDFDFINENADQTIFPASNKVLNDFFGPYLANFNNSFNNIPNDIIVELLMHNAAKSTTHRSRLYFKDMEAGVNMVDNKIVFQPNTLLDDNPIVASNGIIYPSKQLISPPRLSSITGRILMDPQFASMKFLLEETNMLNLIANSEYVTGEYIFGERVKYPKSWTLIAPSEIAFNDSLENTIEAWSIYQLRDLANFLVIPDTAYIDEVDGNSFDKGVFTKQFSNGYYKTYGGTFMRKLGNTVYSSLYTDSVANIVDVIKGSNGVIYIVDDILYTVPSGTTVFSQMLNYISDASIVVQEITNGQHSELVTELRSKTTEQTLFLPNNKAIESYNAIAEKNESLKKWDQLTALEKETIIRNHIVRRRMMIESSETTFYSIVGEQIEIFRQNGQLRIKGKNTITPEASFALTNIQGSNGVLNFIDQVILPE